MEESVSSIYWEAPEHVHIEKTNDWYWMLWIIAIAGSVASIIFGNVLFGVVILLAAMTMFIISHRKPRTIPFEVSFRGIRIKEDLYPYTTLESFSIDEEHPHGIHLIIKQKKLFSSLLIIPLPEEYTDAIEDIVALRLREEHLKEPIAHHILEYLGF
jgi:hypothetical protein